MTEVYTAAKKKGRKRKGKREKVPRAPLLPPPLLAFTAYGETGEAHSLLLLLLLFPFVPSHQKKGKKKKKKEEEIYIPFSLASALYPVGLPLPRHEGVKLPAFVFPVSTRVSYTRTPAAAVVVVNCIFFLFLCDSCGGRPRCFILRLPPFPLPRSYYLFSRSLGLKPPPPSPFHSHHLTGPHLSAWLAKPSLPRGRWAAAKIERTARFFGSRRKGRPQIYEQLARPQICSFRKKKSG